jgi:5'-3' exonuclease/20S proteasome alpha/beta subunit
MYLFASTFEFLHMNLLRDYIALELETSNVVESSPFDIERTIDDFVFLTFFVGNDFLPHMPALDIGDEALDLLIYTYRVARKQWQKQYEKDPTNTPEPYLTYSGEIVSGQRLEHFLYHIGRHESNFYAYKEMTTDYDQIRKTEEKYGEVITPSDEVLKAKENADRNRYRELIQRAVHQSVDAGSNLPSGAKFTPVMASKLTRSDDTSEGGEEDEEGVLGRRMGDILENSIVKDNNLVDNEDKAGVAALVIDETDFKGRYYADKFGFSPYDAEKHLSLRKAYIEGLVWNLRYYYRCHRTTLSWEWFYPYHYGPMISDLIDLDTILSEISFEDRKGAPLKPFEQLLACLPASQSKLLPQPYQGLMTDKDSPIIEFFPRSFIVDMNGKRWPWEAVVLLPFIDSKKLRECSANIDTSELTEQELLRNEFYDAQVICHEESKGKSSSVPLEESSFALVDTKVEPRFRPVVDERTVVPLDGLPTLRDGTVQSLARRRIYVNVHGNKSRYQTAVLEIANEIPELVPLETLSGLIGSTIYINYPALIESLVTAVSNSTMCYRGNDPPILWDGHQAASRKDRVKRIVNAYTKGHGLTGTGGLVLPDSDGQMADRETLLFVRPLKELKTLSDGTVVKSFANYELEVPLFVLSWAPVNEDSRSKGIPLQLEKDPYHCAKRVLTDVSSTGSRNFQQHPIRGSLSSTNVGMFMKGYMQKRQFSILSNSLSNGREPRFYLKPDFAVPRRFGSPSIKIPSNAALQRGRMLAAGLLWAAVIAGINTVQAVGYPNILQKSRDLQQSNMDIDVPSFALEESLETPQAYPLQSRRTAPLQFLHGTTTVSFKYKGGIVAAVDSRASLGDYVGSKTTQKVLPIHPSALGTMAGGAADCTFWIRRLAAEAALYSVENDGKLMSIARASRLLANALYENRAAGLSIGTMIMGFDSHPGSPPRIFYVDNSGRRLEGDMFAVGSGSTCKGRLRRSPYLSI